LQLELVSREPVAVGVTTACRRTEHSGIQMRAGVDAPKLVTEQRPDRQFDGSQEGEGRSAQPGVEVVERDDVAETGPGVKVVLAPRLGLLPERIPVPAQ